VPNSPSHDRHRDGEVEDEKAAADNASDGGKSAERLWKIGEL